jgi:hypothetical protein
MSCDRRHSAVLHEKLDYYIASTLEVPSVRLIHFQTAQCRSFALNVVCRRDSITFGLKEKPKCEARAEFTWMIYVENGQQHQAF